MQRRVDNRQAPRPITVAVDAMGGDHAPGAIVKGAMSAARELDVDIVLVGRAASYALPGLW